MRPDMAEADPADPQPPRDAPSLLLAHPQPDRLRAAPRPWLASTGSSSPPTVPRPMRAWPTDAASSRWSSWRCRAQRPGGAAPARRPRLQRRPLVMAAGAGGRRAAPGGATHGLAHASLVLPCADGVLLRQVWGLLDRDLERRWAQLPPLPKSMVRTTRGLLGHAGGRGHRRRRASPPKGAPRRPPSGGGLARG